MGAFVSVPIDTSTTYTLGRNAIRVILRGGQKALSRDVVDGATISCEVRFDRPVVLKGPKLLEEVSSLLDGTGDPRAARVEYSLPVPDAAAGTAWQVVRAAAAGKSVTATLKIRCKNKNEPVSFRHVCAMVAAGVAWTDAKSTFPSDASTCKGQQPLRVASVYFG